MADRDMRSSFDYQIYIKSWGKYLKTEKPLATNLIPQTHQNWFPAVLTKCAPNIYGGFHQNQIVPALQHSILPNNRQIEFRIICFIEA